MYVFSTGPVGGVWDDGWNADTQQLPVSYEDVQLLQLVRRRHSQYSTGTILVRNQNACNASAKSRTFGENLSATIIGTKKNAEPTGLGNKILHV